MDANMRVTQRIMAARQGHAVSICRLQLEVQVEAQMRLHVLAMPCLMHSKRTDMG